MVQGRKQNRRIEIHSPETAEEAIDSGFDEGSRDEPAISLEDLGDAYAAVLKMHQSTESHNNIHDGVDDRAPDANKDDVGTEGTAEASIGRLGGRIVSPEMAGTSGPATENAPRNPPAEGDTIPEGGSRIRDSVDVPVSLVSILESICFVGTRDGKPIPLSFLVEALRDFSETEIREGIDSLNQQLRTENSAMVVDAVGDGFKIVLAPDLVGVAEGISGPTKESQLTQAAIDCLSLIAYQPGITKDEIEKQWGQPAGGTLANLSKKGLIKTASETTAASRGSDDTTSETFALSAHSPPKTQPRYFTTDRFLGILGLQSLDDLPRGDEL